MHRKSIWRLLKITIVLVAAAYAFKYILMQRSTTVRLESAGYDLTYTMAWGWGMEQKVTLKPVGNLMPSHSSEWKKIWKKPYNSGLAVYRSVEEEIYYFGIGIRCVDIRSDLGNVEAHLQPK